MTVQAETNGRPATDEFVQYEVADGVATIWLNRPEVKNCVNWGLLTQLGAALERAEDDDDARVVLIRGRGQTFCAGADLNMLDSEFLGTTNNSVKIAQVSARTFDRAFNLGKPTIAVVEGHAVAGGFELMISCDFAIAADDAKIGDFHIRRALFGGAGPIYRLPRTRPAQDQGTALHRKLCRARSARSGDWPTCPPPPTSSRRRSPTSSPR
jgi:enoyl-CoA hydratase/carnithine racemase